MEALRQPRRASVCKDSLLAHDSHIIYMRKITIRFALLNVRNGSISFVTARKMVLTR
jgi:hypothetical protein